MIDDGIETTPLLLPSLGTLKIMSKCPFAGTTCFAFVGDGADAGVMLILSQQIKPQVSMCHIQPSILGPILGTAALLIC